MFCRIARHLAADEVARDVNDDLGQLLSVVFGQIHNAWIKLDFKETTASGNYKMRQFSPEYGFELEKTLEKFLVKELLDPKERVRLLESLERGNRQAVTFKGEDGEHKQFIEANPQFKSITIFDENQKRIRQQDVLSQGQKDNRKTQNATPLNSLQNWQIRVRQGMDKS